MMGYATVMKVPRVSNYIQAKGILTATKPIRGTTTVPLGNRRDHHQYSIRMNGDDVEMVCYKTPVVTFHPDDSITLRTDGWCSVSTHQFIQQVTGIPAGGRGQYTVLQLKDSKVAITGNESASFVMRDGNWSCVTDNRRPSYRINRKSANNVRLRYKEFGDYIKAFAKLRGEIIKPRYMREFVGFTLTFDELKSAFEIDVDGDLVWGDTDALMYRSNKYHKQRGNELIAMMTSGDPEQFYKATLILYGDSHRRYHNIKTLIDGWTVPAKRGPDNYNEFVLRWHAEEVVEQCETKPNAVPNMVYQAWLTPKRED